MDPSLIHIPLDQLDANDNQFESLKSFSKYFMYSSVPENEWSSHLKRLYDFYESIYRCLDSLPTGYNVLQLLDIADNRIDIHSLIKSYSEKIVLYAVRNNQNTREIAEVFSTMLVDG